MTHTLLLDVAEGTTHDTLLAKDPLYHVSDAARGHKPGADAPRGGMRQRRDVRPPKSIIVAAFTVRHHHLALGAFPVSGKPLTVSRWWY
jgi:hypothetical protein